jgi:hypothetical protein
MGHTWGTHDVPSLVSCVSERDLDAIPVTCATAGGYGRQSEEPMIGKFVANCQTPSLAPFIEGSLTVNSVMNRTAMGSCPG